MGAANTLRRHGRKPGFGAQAWEGNHNCLQPVAAQPPFPSSLPRTTQLYTVIAVSSAVGYAGGASGQLNSTSGTATVVLKTTDGGESAVLHSIAAFAGGQPVPPACTECTQNAACNFASRCHLVPPPWAEAPFANCQDLLRPVAN